MPEDARLRVAKSARPAIALAWQAAPAHVTGYIFAAVITGAAPVAVAWPTKLLVDRLAVGPLGRSDVARLAAGIAVAGIFAALLPQVEQYLRREIDRRVQLTAITELYTAVDRFVGLARFEDPAFLDRLQLARASGVSTPGQCVDGMLGMLQAVVTVSGFAGALSLLQPWVALLVVVIGTVPALYAQLALSQRRASIMAATSHAERRELFYSSLMTDPRAAKEVRLFGAGEFLKTRMAAEMSHINTSYRRIDRRILVVQGGLSLLGAVLAGALLMWTVRETATGTLTVGDVVLVVAAVASVQAALSTLVTNAVAVHEALLLFSHYVAVVRAPPDLPVPAAPQPAPPLRRGIELRDVWFRYADDQPWVLQGINLCLPSIGTTAVVGLNGAGKTTRIKLLCRLYDPSRGVVCWDGVDLRDLDPIQLRRRIRAVFQDATAYDLTAAENIAIGDLEVAADHSQIVRAAQQAGAHAMITNLPAGYDTLLSRIFYATAADRNDPGTGATLSGGQWQRLALARGLLLADPDLLVLDEPTAALDAEAEHDTHKRLRRLRAGLATLLVSHRLGVVRDADLIVVLTDGRVAEQGPHDELIDRGGAYARLFALQADGYRSGASKQFDV